MKLTSLGSGSSGNAFLLELPDRRILFDCGVGVRVIQKALAGSDLPITMFISHEHGDHVRSMASVLKKHVCDVYATAGTLRALGQQAGWQTVRAGERTSVNDISISFVGVSHDALEPCGFYIETPDQRISIITDLGCSNSDVMDVLSESDVAVLESNYDDGMLRKSQYPAHLKRRIRSSVGHLSNEDCATTLVHAVGEDMQGVWLCHLSHNNNTPEAAVGTSREALLAAGRDVPVAALARFDATPILPFTPPPRQQALFTS